MKVGIFTNKLNIKNNALESFLIEELKSRNYNVSIINELSPETDIECLFVIGGDGTILKFNSFLTQNQIPIVSINGGTFGFLTEFESNEIKEAITLFENNKLVKDERLALKVEVKGKSYYAINEVSIQRLYEENYNSLVIELDVLCDDTLIERIKGDGILVSTPTGSTAYSLSAGGSILSPDIEGLIITPLMAHSLHVRPMVISAKSKVNIVKLKQAKAGVYVDGKLVEIISQNESVNVERAENKIIFLRKSQSNFYKKLQSKFEKGNYE